MRRTREIPLVYLAAYLATAILHPAISAAQGAPETTPLSKQVAKLEETVARDEKKFGGFFPGKPYVDRGISGQTTPQMLIRFRPDVIALKPKAVVILAGTNDVAGNTGPMSLEEIEGNLESMSQLAHANGIRVVLASVLPVHDAGHRPDGSAIVVTERRPPAKILALNEWIKNYAAKHGDVYLDYFSAMVDERGFLKKELSEDGLHPNKAGYAVMAPLAEKAIVNALAAKK